MYSGTMIDDLIRAVQKAETEAKQSPTAPKAKQAGAVELQAFMHQLQFGQRTHLGVA